MIMQELRQLDEGAKKYSEGMRLMMELLLPEDN